MEFKGTKGEWFAEKPESSNGYWYVNTDERTMGGVATCYDSEARYNANLIAAAPELLEFALSFSRLLANGDIDILKAKEGSEKDVANMVRLNINAIEKALK